MKQNFLAGILLLSLCVFGLTACNDDDKNPGITLKGIEGNELTLTFPNSEEVSYELQGGEGKYTAKSAKTDVVTAEAKDGKLVMKVVALGEAIVTVTDEADNKLDVKVTVAYETLELKVKEIKADIKGEELDKEEKEAIEEAALETVPVKAGGGYVFTYTNEERTEGKVAIYKDKFGDKAIESTFEVIDSETEKGTSRTTFSFAIDKEKREFVLVLAPATRATAEPKIDVYLEEDVTEDFEKYENVEEVITVQVVE